MFAYIKGHLVASQPTSVIVDVQGIGYTILIPYRVLGELPSFGEMVQLYTTFVVREASHTLYGFLDAQERDIFEVLMNVSGIGPKLALSLLGHLTLPELQHAVSQQNLTTLCRVPGVGKKTAERLIVELKDKVSSFPMLSHSPLSDAALKPTNVYAQDAILALINLGYQQHVAQKAVKQSLKELPEDSLQLSLLITTALRHITS